MEYFEENKSLFSFKGVLGRRDFIVIYLVIGIIASVFYHTPLFYAILHNPELIKTLSSPNLPMWASVLMIVAGVVTGLLIFPANVRRIRDIIGEENDNKIFLIASICLAVGIISVTPAGIKFGAGFIDLFIDLCLIFMKGSITGSKPKNDIIKFNWGAFFGTWIWGLWNRCYITLFMIPLLATCGGWILFMLVCGLKGNEWAYNKQKSKFEEVEKFHKSQSNQAAVFIVLAPIITIICTLALAVTSFSVLHKYIQNHPKVKTKITTQLNNYQLKATEANFDKIEITDNEYRFYLKPQGWNKLSDYAKTTFFEHALNYALIKNDMYINGKGEIEKYLQLAQKIKIISTFNGETLIEFTPTEEQLKQLQGYSSNQDFKTFWALRRNCIKINKSPSLP